LNSSSFFVLLERDPGFECRSLLSAVSQRFPTDPIPGQSMWVLCGQIDTDALFKVLRFSPLSLVPQMLRIYARAHSSTVKASLSQQS
jgi:hypothetical protein